MVKPYLKKAAPSSSHWSNEVHPMSQAAMEFSGGKDLSQEIILKKIKDVYDFRSVVDLGAWKMAQNSYINGRERRAGVRYSRD